MTDPTPLPAAQPWWQHVAIRNTRRRAHRRPIDAADIARRATWVAAGLVIVTAAAGIRGPLTWAALALLGTALTVRVFIAAHRDMQRISHLIDAGRHR